MADQFVDYLNGDDTTGSGTVGSPWKTIQKGVDSATDSTDWIYCRDNAEHILTSVIDVTAISPRNATDYFNFSGYTTSAGDTGICKIKAPAGMTTWLFGGNSENTTYVSLHQMIIDGNGSYGTGYLIKPYYGFLRKVCLHSGGSYGVNGARATDCWFMGQSVASVQYGTLEHCLVTYGAAVSPSNYAALAPQSMVNCFVHFDSNNTTDSDRPNQFIYLNGHNNNATNNSLYIDENTGTMLGTAINRYRRKFSRNLCEGGAKGFENDTTHVNIGEATEVIKNGFYNCTDWDAAVGAIQQSLLYENEEITGGSPFAKAGNIPTDPNDFVDQTAFWAAVHDWFAPTEYAVVGGEVIGAYRPADAGGGGTAGMLRRSNQRGGY